MAIVVPYGDTQAHGSLACSITFRRFRNKVVMEKKPYPTQPNTPEQKAIRNKFKQAWKAYHQLSPWTVEYLRQSAKQYGWSGANLFISQYMQDEVPSTIPMNNMKEITDLSLPQPIAPDPDGIKHQFRAIVDSPHAEILLADIFDNENVYNPGIEAIAYNRSRLDLSRTDPTPIDIPANYPIILVWTDFNNVERTNLIRLPALTLQQSGIPSTTPIANVKEIVSANIHSTIGATSKNIYFEFWNVQTTTPPDNLIGRIYDNENVYHPVQISPEAGQFYIGIYTYNPSPITLVDGYQISITYNDFSDVPHTVDIIFPEMQVGPAPTASNTPLTDFKIATEAQVLNPVGRSVLNIVFNFKTVDPALTDIRNMWDIYDTENVIDIWIASAPNYLYLLDTYANPPERFTMPFDYTLRHKYLDQGDVEKEIYLGFPSWIPAGVNDPRFWIADDGTLYWDKDFNEIAHIRGTPRTLLWPADDGTTYWDATMTALAKSHVAIATPLYIASDFSLYYDQALTNLASTPFF